MRAHFFLLLLVAAALALATAAPLLKQPRAVLSNGRALLYARQTAPAGWERLQPAAPSEPVSFTLVLEGSNSEVLEERFWHVSDPEHALYGEFMTAREIEDLVKPDAASLAALYATLQSHGISADAVISHGDSLDVKATVEQASSFFSTTFYTFRHSRSGGLAIRQWGECSLSPVIADQVVLVLGVSTFPTTEQRWQRAERMRQARQRRAGASPNADSPLWVPQAVAALYGLPFPIAPLSTPDVSAGVIEWEKESFSPSDLTYFSLNTSIPLAPVDAHQIVGNNSIARPGIEASLDIQWLEGIAPGATPWFWLVNNVTAWMLTFTVEFLTATDYPSIISLSYGVPEMDNCDFFQPSDCNGVSYAAYMQIVDKQFMKMGLIGVSILVASGDAGTTGEVSVSVGPPNDGVIPFQAGYPASSPFITSVGATEVSHPEFELPNPPPACQQPRIGRCVSNGTEKAVSDDVGGYTAGGGFSDVDSMPAYQAAAVAAYLSSGVPLPVNKSWYRPTGRAFPDVTAIGYNGYIVDRGRGVAVSGTSMSTPLFAGVMANLQAEYAAITNRTLGFLNPMLYAAQAAGGQLFKDITEGDNCQTDKCKGVQDGFLAWKGWDPVTGLGSPLYQNMKRYIQKLGHRVVQRRQARMQ